MYLVWWVAVVMTACCIINTTTALPSDDRDAASLRSMIQEEVREMMRATVDQRELTAMKDEIRRLR